MTTAPDSAPSVRFTVPGEPMPKERAEPTVGKRKLEDGSIKHFAKFRPATRTADYEKTVRLCALAARPSGWPRHCRYRVDLVIFRTATDKGGEGGDIDNYTKSALDGVNPVRAKYKGKGPNKHVVQAAVPGVLWLDDRRVYEGSQRIVDVEPRDARLEVTVTALAVNCVNKTCRLPTCDVDEDGRCPACHRALEEKRARRST